MYSEGYDTVSPNVVEHDFQSEGMFVIDSEIIPVTYARGLFVLKLDPKTGAYDTRVGIKDTKQVAQSSKSSFVHDKMHVNLNQIKN